MLSIITITKNDIAALRRTINSTEIFRNEFASIEQIVIDGSDDFPASDNLVFCSTQRNVHYFRREARGISDAFNFGISKAEYKWLWFLNGGDQLSPELDLNFFYSFLKNVSADILIFQRQLMQQSTVVQFPAVARTFPPVLPWIPHPATIVSKETFRRYGTFNEKYKIAMDYDFWIRVFGRNVVVNMVSIPIMLFDENGVSSTELALVNREGKEVLKRNKKLLLRIWINMARSILKQYKSFKRSSDGY